MAKHSVTCYVDRHKKRTYQVLRQFAYPINARMAYIPEISRWEKDIGVFFGVSDTTKEVFDRQRDNNLPWIYIDNGYFKPRISQYEAGDKKPFYRATYNALQMNKIIDTTEERWERLGLELNEPKPRGDEILFCPPHDLFCRLVLGIDNHLQYRDRCMALLQQYTDRPINVRVKPRWAEEEPPPLVEDFAKAHIVVTVLSNVAVEAILYGLPVLLLDDRSAAHPLTTQVENIETPYLWTYPMAYDWACNLANHQWTLEEMRKGICWKYLKENYLGG